MKLSSQELRIGNKIEAKNSKDKWMPLTVDFEYLRLIHDYPKDYRPIPLTQEVLKHLGFKCRKRRWPFFSPIKGINPRPEEFIVTVKRAEALYSFQSTGHSIRYFHQLQNLYFALTGREIVPDVDNQNHLIE